MSTAEPRSAPSPTAELAAFAAGLTYEEIPAPVVEHAKLAILDLLGCALYGSSQRWTALVHDYVADERARPTCTVWGTALRTSPSLAALANGTAAHAAEIDDLHRGSFYHPGAATVPAVLAAVDSHLESAADSHIEGGVGGHLEGAVAGRLDGRVDGRVDGRALLTAVVAGYEVGTRVGAALGQGHFLAGYHPQGTVGVFGAAAGAGRLWGLDAARLVHAYGIAGTSASGLMAAQEGAMVKRAHAGLAGQAGVRAVALAARGFTGIEDVLEAGFGGLLSTLGTTDSDVDSLTAGLGTVWQTSRVEFKRHAACAAIHTSLDVVEDLCAAHGIGAPDVAGVSIRCTTHSFLHCGFAYRPAGATAAQMSYQYCVAAMLTFGAVSVAQFAEPLLADPGLLDLAGRVEVTPDERLDARGPDRRHSVEVEIRTRSGASLRGERTQRRGGADEPLPAAQVIEKFQLLVAQVAPRSRADALLERVLTLEEGVDMRELSGLLRGVRG